MQGIELSRRFYVEVVRPFLDRRLPGLLHDAAVLGYGSELLGFDDETSRDHNWGPRAQIVVRAGDFDAVAPVIVHGFDGEKPAAFLGEPIGYRNRPHPPAEGAGRLGSPTHGVEVVTVAAILKHTLALDAAEPLDAATWLSLPEQRLIELTAGETFHDGIGEVAALRARFARPPLDVVRCKLAGQWRRIAEEQAFVGRAGQVGDELGSRVIAARLARDIMRIAFLIAGVYAPYAKWFGSAFARLPAAAALSPLLDEMLATDSWQRRQRCLAEACLTLAELHAAAGFPLAVTPVITPYFGRPFDVINADDIAASLDKAITDPQLRALARLGSVEQITDATPVLMAPERARRLTDALLQP